MAAEAAISSTVELLGGLLIQKVKFLRGVEEQVQLLKDELKRMQSFLIDANKKQAEDERVRNWISEMREVAQDAEDTIEMFLLNVENVRSRKLLERCTGFAKRMHHLDRIGEEIESIQKRLEAMNRSREMYGIKDLGQAWPPSVSARRGAQVESWRRLAPWKKDEHLVGMDDDAKKLLRKSILDEEKKGLSVVVIEGMGGIGKSTLARAIYNHPDVVVADRFDCRAWVVVSSEFTPQETIKQLIFELCRSEEDKKKRREEIKELEESTKDRLYLQRKLQEMLYEQLRGKTYFIVLDDVWEKEHWEFLSTVFPDEQDKRSRLLLTTRSKVIAKCGQYAHEMKLLDLEKSWELFMKKAVIDKSDGECPQALEYIGRNIVDKCNGLPLAICVVGGLLVGTQTKSGWEQVLHEINSHLGRAESSVSAILELSYQNLSPQLKSCFLCLAFFKEDATISVKRLVHIWVAQGLIRQEGGRTVEEIGRVYSDELINRNMVQINDLNIDDRVKSCRLHDLLREVCLRKAKDEIGFEIVKGEAEISSESSYKARHCVVYGKDLTTLLSNRSKHLRSLFLLTVNANDLVYVSSRSRDWKKFQLLKILDLDGFGFRRLPHSFRALLGLKYLRIRNYIIGILKLPSWLDQLKELEVLDLDTEFVEFPCVTLKMDRLRYFCAKDVRGPIRIDNWKNIETLKYIMLEDWMRYYNSRLMTGCRELGIYLDLREPPRDDELRRVRASLEKLEDLVSLHLKWKWLPTIATATATAIIPLHLGNLTKLALSGLMSKCPGASVFPPNLSHLTLAVAWLYEDPMAELGKLRKLLYLKLKGANWLQRMQVLHDGFPCLKALSLQRMDLLEGIDIEEGGMPQLKQLRIHRCRKLVTENLPEHIIVSAA